jgi:hypothetical protein
LGRLSYLRTAKPRYEQRHPDGYKGEAEVNHPPDGPLHDGSRAQPSLLPVLPWRSLSRRRSVDRW